MDAEVVVRDVPERNRYEAVIDGKVAGLIEYRVANGDRAFMHTEVSDEFEGKGVGSELVRGVLDAERAAGRRIVPLCPFVAHYVREHPDDYGDLVDTELTQRLRASLG